jgi:hypothetical protein
MDKEVTEKILQWAKKKHEGLSEHILCLTIFDVRRIIENTVRETRRHIAKELMEDKEAAIKKLLDNQ